MGARFGTPEWARSLEEEINSSSEYRNAAASWGLDFNGNLVLAFEADEALPAARSVLLRLRGGACQGVELVDGPSPPDAGFVLWAPFSLWKEILERKTLAATAILTGRMRVEGDKMTLFKFLAAHRALIHCAASLDTVFS